MWLKAWVVQPFMMHASFNREVTPLSQHVCESSKWKRRQCKVEEYCKLYICPCSIDAEMAKGLKKITDALSPIQKEYGGCIPNSVISEAMDKAGFAEYAQDWLFQQQGQHYCTCVCILLPSTTPDTWFRVQGVCMYMYIYMHMEVHLECNQLCWVMRSGICMQ